METESNLSHILSRDGQPGHFPMHRLKRVDKPTNLVTDGVERVDYRENALDKALRGDFGAAMQKARLNLSVKYPMVAAQKEILLHLASIKDNEVAARRAPLPPDPKVLSRHIKHLGYFLKADIMGICRLPGSAIYSHDLEGSPINIDYQYAIVIVMRQEPQTIMASTGTDWATEPLSFQCYQHLAFVAHTMANYIRRLGYPASAEHLFKPRGYQVLMPPLLLQAGIGELSRPGIIVNPFLGLGYKAAAVLTDLPLEPDKPVDFGLQDFCQHCQRCARACPSRAISTGDKVMHNGYETWKLDVERCAKFFLSKKEPGVCARCVRVCPWTRPTTPPHNLVRWAVQRSSLARRLAIKADSITGFPEGDRDGKWWFDLEEVDGALKTAPYYERQGKPKR